MVSLASSGGDQTIRLWDVETAPAEKYCKGTLVWSVQFQFSPVGLPSGTGRFWSVVVDGTTSCESNNGECLKTLRRSPL